jgi:hypothetical protein
MMGRLNALIDDETDFLSPMDVKRSGPRHYHRSFVGRYPIMDIIIERHGRFELMQIEEGFCWRLTTRGGEKWYWHPETGMWTANWELNPTKEKATVDLDWTLAHEDAGDLDEQHCAPPPEHLLS